MPAKNTVKSYLENGVYHIYNRGVDKRIIFTDQQDYKVFLSYFKLYLTPPIDPYTTSYVRPEYLPKNYHKDIDLVAYCLMPNHFHLLVQQRSKLAIASFMQSLGTKYSIYFNKRHQRSGALFQSRYKAALVDKDAYLVHLSRYIHLNPKSINQNLISSYSSYADYLGLRQTTWIKPQLVLSNFTQYAQTPLVKHQTYKGFIEDHEVESAKILGKLTLEE